MVVVEFKFESVFSEEEIEIVECEFGCDRDSAIAFLMDNIKPDFKEIDIMDME